MRQGYKGVGIAAAAVVVWGLSAAINHAAGPAGAVAPTAVAVVNLVEVFNQYEKTKVVNQKLADHRNNLGQEAERKQAKIKALRDTRDAFNVDSKEWYTKDEELRKAQFEFGVWESLEKDRVMEAHKRWTKLTYKTITDEIQRVAKTRGYHMVITSEELDEETDDIKVLLRQIFNRKVVYADGSVDITSEVLRSLNAEFEKSGGAKSVEFLK